MDVLILLQKPLWITSETAARVGKVSEAEGKLAACAYIHLHRYLLLPDCCACSMRLSRSHDHLTFFDTTECRFVAQYGPSSSPLCPSSFDHLVDLDFELFSFCCEIALYQPNPLAVAHSIRNQRDAHETNTGNTLCQNLTCENCCCRHSMNLKRFRSSKHHLRKTVCANSRNNRCLCTDRRKHIKHHHLRLPRQLPLSIRGPGATHCSVRRAYSK